MDFSKALTYPFEDQDWAKKLGLAALIQFIPILGQIALQGWAIETARNVKANNPMPLAGWDDFGGTISRGLNIFLASIVYSLPGLLFICVGYIAWIAMTAGGASSDSDAGSSIAGAGQLVLVCCGCLGFLVLLASEVVFAGGYLRYMDRPEFGTFMQFGENFALVQNNMGDFLMALLFIIGGVFVASLVGSITVVGSLLLAPFAGYFASHIIGQLAVKLAGAAKPAM